MARHLRTAPASLVGKTRTRTVRAPATTAPASCITVCRQLLATPPDASNPELARLAVAAFHALDETGREQFFDALADEFAVEPAAARPELFLRLNSTPGGVSALVEMRQRLLHGLACHPSWRNVEADLTLLLRVLFNRAGLDFQQIDCETPAPVLEKLFKYEAVHEIHGWADLRRRLDADRRCYGLFHPGWPGEPLIFTEVALTRGMSASLGPVLDPSSPVSDAEACDAAIFYSISNCQPGLSGFSLGNALIGCVIDALRTELPRLTTFATLSPIPGFRAWLEGAARTSGDRTLAELLARLGEPGWHDDPEVGQALKAALMPLCATYLLHARQGDEPADPVARFHLSNGACLARVNWLSDLSPAGLKRSFGMTANYLYRPASLSGNREAYARTHRVMTSRRVERLSRRTAA